MSLRVCGPLVGGRRSRCNAVRSPASRRPEGLRGRIEQPRRPERGPCGSSRSSTHTVTYRKVLLFCLTSDYTPRCFPCRSLRSVAFAEFRRTFPVNGFPFPVWRVLVTLESVPRPNRSLKGGMLPVIVFRVRPVKGWRRRLWGPIKWVAGLAPIVAVGFRPKGPGPRSLRFGADAPDLASCCTGVCKGGWDPFENPASGVISRVSFGNLRSSATFFGTEDIGGSDDLRRPTRPSRRIPH